MISVSELNDVPGDQRWPITNECGWLTK